MVIEKLVAHAVMETPIKIRPVASKSRTKFPEELSK